MILKMPNQKLVVFKDAASSLTTDMPMPNDLSRRQFAKQFGMATMGLAISAPLGAAESFDVSPYVHPELRR